MATVNDTYSITANLTQVINENQKLTNAVTKLLLAEQQLQGEILRVTKSIDAEGNAVSKVTVKLSEAVTQTYKFNSAQELLGRTVVDLSAKLDRQRKAAEAANRVPPKMIAQQIQTQLTNNASNAASPKAISADLENVIGQTQKANQAALMFGITWESLGRLLTIQLMHQAISQLTQAIKQGTKDAIEFQIRISEIRTISQEAAISQDNWAEGIRNVSNSFGFDILDTAEAAYQALSNQVTKGADTFKFMEEASRLAVTTVASVADSTNALSAVMNSYGLKTKDAAEISAKLFVAVNLGRFRLDEAADSLGNITVLSNQTGVSFNELMAGMIAMTNQGFTWSQSMTQMRGIMTQLIKPSKDMDLFLKSIGASSGEMAIKMYGLTGLLDLLSKATNNSSTALAEEFRNVRGLLGVLSLTGPGHKAFIEAQERLSTSTQEYFKASAIAMESHGKSVQVEGQKLKNYFITEIGANMLATMDTGIKAMGGLENGVKQGINGIGIAVTAGAALYVTKMTLMATATEAMSLRIAAANVRIGTSLSKATGWIGLIVTGFSLALEAATVYYDKVADREKKIYEDFKKGVTERKAILDEFNRNAINPIVANIEAANRAVAIKVGERIGEINASILAAINNAKEASKMMGEAANGVLQNLRTSLADTKSLLKENEALLEKLKKDRADSEKKFRAAKENIERMGLADNPQKDFDLLQRDFRELGKDLDSSRLLGDKERLAAIDTLEGQVIKNITDRATLEKNTNEENIKRAAKRLDLEEDLRKKKVALSEQIRKDLAQEDALNTKTQTRSVKDKEANIQRIMKLRQDEFDKAKTLMQKEYDANAPLDLKKFDSVKALAAARKKIEAEREKVGTKVTNKVEEQKVITIDIPAQIRQVKNLLAKLERNEIDDILKNTDPEKIKAAFASRLKLLEELIPMLQSKLDTLPEIEKSVFERAIKSLVDEKIAVELSTVDKPVLEANAKVSQAAMADAKKQIEALLISQKQITDAKSDLEQTIFTALKTFDVTKAGSIAEAESIYKIRESSPNIMGLIDKVIKLFPKEGAKAFGLLPPELLANLAQFKGMPSDSVARYIKLSATYDEQQQQIVNLNNKSQALARSMGVTTDLMRGFNGAQQDFTTNVGYCSTAIDNLRLKLEGLTTVLSNMKIPTPAEPLSAGIKGSKFALGGMMGTDSIPAMLSPGEFVMNAQSTRKFHSQLVAMNSIGRFANGGPTSNVNVGDVNINMRSSGNESVDVIKIGRMLQREVRRGTVSLS